MAIPKVVLFYAFHPVADPEAVRLWQRDLCEGLGLRGRIIVSAHGINATVGGDVTVLKTFVRKTRELPRSGPSTSSGPKDVAWTRTVGASTSHGCR